MKLNKRLTPYPILSSDDDDYVDSYFDTHIKQNVEFGEMKIEISFSLKNDGLNELISKSLAKYVVHFECSVLSYRKIITTDKENADMVVDLKDISNTIEVSTYIVATENIPKYYNPKFNWEYGDEGVDIEKGNVLAIGPTYIIDVDRNKDGLKKLSDIISIKQYDNGFKKEMSVALEGDVIIIFVNEEIKNLYFIHGKQYLYNIISMIMVPAMMYILTRMKDNRDDLKEYRWFRVIENLLNQYDIDIDQLRDDESDGKYSIYTIAQKIFRTPLMNGLNELNIIEERVSNG